MKVLITGLLVAASALAQHGEGAAAEPDLTMWKWLNFAILAGVLGYLAVKSAGPYFSARAEEIRQGIADAQKVKAEAEAKAAEIDRRIANLGAEIEALRVAGRTEAAAETERLRREGVHEVARIAQQTDQEIAAALKAAKADLRRHAAQLAVDLARQKAAARISAEDQDALVQSFAANLKSSR